MIIEGGLMFDKGGHSRHADTPSINFFTAATLGCRKINLIVVLGFRIFGELGSSQA